MSELASEQSTPSETYTVEELIEVGSARVDGLFDRLGRITASAVGSGVEVRVNLEGRLIGLDLGPEAMALQPEELAAEICRLAHEASAAALSEGLAALEPAAGPELTAELAEIVSARPASAMEVTEISPRERDEDLAVESWALPR